MSANNPSSPLSPTALRSRALAMLTRREHSQTELRQKLAELGGERDVIDAIITELSNQQWQDDRRFTEVFVRSYARKGHGELSIRQELKQRGIDAELITEVLAEHDWFTLAKETRERKFGESVPEERKEQARQIRFLQYRGFTSEQCWTTFKKTD